jgi:chaperonin GroES
MKGKGRQARYFNNHVALKKLERQRKVETKNKAMMEKYVQFYKDNAPFLPINDYILVEKNSDTQIGLIELPETKNVNMNNEVQILRASRKVVSLYPQMYPGMIALHASGSRTRNCFERELKSGTTVVFQFLKISEIGALVFPNDRIIPLGRTVRVRRLIHEEKTSGGIIIPEAQPTKDQAKEGVVLGIGMPSTKDKQFQNKFTPFCKVKWKKWKESHIEVLIKGQYDLIIPEDDITHIDYDYDIKEDQKMLESLQKSR